ncbi:hypothetical protein GCM10010885_00370 [Alicyclobacillus cellulosilyticus]|uniref:Flagellar assembly protein FliH/Type III secretion system HrpE domain-containing protein n=1 Tax=Alicyclobacillus cellulosilyticus TaxID=1003997 RepID=A0A917NEB1_9BACL|nr:FliH/SctL family protein [Alicyclobacillus cellulosilyticus]GGI94776.1 hypothetical protein GCM10010885_00370 [Alicyclobacillus cellulosilyticus]
MSNRLQKIPAARVVEGGTHAIPAATRLDADTPQGAPGAPGWDEASFAAREAALREREAQVEAECAKRLAAAAAEAERIIANAQARAEEMEASARAKGYEQGYREGFAAGELAGHELFSSRLQELAEMALRLNEQRNRWLLHLKDQFVRLAMAAVERILHRELAIAPADVAAEVEHLLQYVSVIGRVEVHVHPSAFMAASEAQPRWRSARFGEWEIVVVPDARVRPGGCEIWSPSGRVDATLETKLEILEQTLAELAEDGGFADERVFTG